MAWRNLFAEIHLWLGLTLCLPLVVVGLTGSVLVYHEELDSLFNAGGPGSASPEVVGERRPPAAVVAAARARAPEGAEPVFLRWPSAPGQRLATVGFRGPDGGFRGGPRFEVDTVSLAVEAPANRGGGAFMRTMHVLHGSLMLPGGVGRRVVGWLGVVMLALGLSGLVIWWPRPGRLRQALSVKWRAGAQRLNRDLHGAAGIWLWLVFVLVSFSGVHIVFPQTLGAGLDLVLPGSGAPTAPAVPDRTEAVGSGGAPDLVAAARIARALRPEAAMALVRMPFRPGQDIRVALKRPGSASGAPSITVDIDPRSGAVTALSDPKSMPAAALAAAWMRPLHEGRGLGPVWRLLVFLSGLLPLLFSITGIAFWLLRRRSRRSLEERKRLAAAPRGR